MKRLIALACLAALLLSHLTACSRADGGSVRERTFFGMDTVVTVRLSYTDDAGRALSDDALRSAFDECEAVFFAVEAACSRTAETSETYRLNHSADGIVSENADFLAVLSLALEVADLTGGACSPTLGVLTDLWDVTGDFHLPAAAELTEAMRHTDYRAVRVDGNRVTKTDPAVVVDLGAIAKGYAAQKMIDCLSASAVSWGLVSIGGNIGVFGEKPDGTPFRIGVTDPFDPSRVRDYLEITEGFVAVSGDYERYVIVDGVRYHHIFDPATGYPAASGVRSAAVWCRQGAWSDALSTALFVFGTERAAEFAKTSPVPFSAYFTTTENETVRVETTES